MLSMETCISPDGTISYDNPDTCASMGLDKYHWQVEPFHHIWMWMQTPAGNVTVVMAICAFSILVMEWKHASRVKPDANQTA